MTRHNFRKSKIGVGSYPDCKTCKGSGFRMYDTDMGQRTRPCDCWIKVAIVKNLHLTWPFMAKQVTPVKDSPLVELDKSGKLAIITASQKTLAAHLKGCMIAHGFEQDDPCWWVEVTSDKDIVEAWLYTARLRGEEIYDADISSSIFHPENPRSIKELALSADLMVIQLGKKISPNKETDTTFLEALEYRIDNALKTWITISPRQSLEELQADSPKLRETLEDYGFEDIVLDASEVDEVDLENLISGGPSPAKVKRAQSIIQKGKSIVTGGRPMLTMSQGGGSAKEQTDQIDALSESSEDRKRRKNRNKSR